MNATEGIYGLDLSGRGIFCNRSCARILGYDDQEGFLGKRIKVHQSKDILWKKDNAAIPVEYRAYSIYKDEGGGTFADITERVLAEAEAEKFQAALCQAQKMETCGTRTRSILTSASTKI